MNLSTRRTVTATVAAAAAAAVLVRPRHRGLLLNDDTRSPERLAEALLAKVGS